MIRYYWTFIVAFLLLVFIGVPIIAIGHILRKLFGVEDFVFPPAKFGCRVYVWAAGARPHVSGLEHLDRDQAYVFIANHQSNLDPPLLFAYLGHNVGAIAKIELSRDIKAGKGIQFEDVDQKTRKVKGKRRVA